MLSTIHTGSAASIYYRIARMHARRYHEIDAQLAKLHLRGNGSQARAHCAASPEALIAEREQSAIIVITFACMSIEAFLHDYAAARLGLSFAQENLDKLDIRSKYQFYPRLACGRPPDRTGPAYAKLNKIVTLRNDLRHFKDLSSASTFHDQLCIRLRAGVDDAVECIMLLMEELERLHGGNDRFGGAMDLRIEPFDGGPSG